MFDRSACAKVRLAAEPHTDLSALVMLGALLRDVRNRRSTASDAADSGLSPLSGDQNQGETHATPEQTEAGSASGGRAPHRLVGARNARGALAGRRRVPQQIDLFAANAPTIGGMPAWFGLPMETQAALTILMTRLILDHAEKRQMGSTRGGHDL
jgi:hypothetical protein